jgi:hypothetical protein
VVNVIERIGRHTAFDLKHSGLVGTHEDIDELLRLAKLGAATEKVLLNHDCYRSCSVMNGPIPSCEWHQVCKLRKEGNKE